jgi:hypothetical protein
MAKDKRKQRPAQGPGPASARHSTASIAWPVFKPALPVRHLALETLVEEKVVLLHNFFPKSLCKDYVAFLQTLPLTTTPGKPRKGEAVRVKYGTLFSARGSLPTAGVRADHETPRQRPLPDRRCSVFRPVVARDWLEGRHRVGGCRGDEETLVRCRFAHKGSSHKHMTALLSQDRGGEVLGLSPNIRVYRYKKGQFFDCHCTPPGSSLRPPSAVLLPREKKSLPTLLQMMKPTL